MGTLILLSATLQAEINSSWEYIIGAAIALMILGYLLFTLIKPEKF
ncbi:MAG: K(+)-transporting ATPase subunit F [Lentimicrobiaceae bacterium]